MVNQWSVDVSTNIIYIGWYSVDILIIIHANTSLLFHQHFVHTSPVLHPYFTKYQWTINQLLAAIIIVWLSFDYIDWFLTAKWSVSMSTTRLLIIGGMTYIQLLDYIHVYQPISLCTACNTHDLNYQLVLFWPTCYIADFSFSVPANVLYYLGQLDCCPMFQ